MSLRKSKIYIIMSNAKLIEQLKKSGALKSAAIAQAFRATPRHRFLPLVTAAEAYQDKAIVTKMQDGVPISSGSQPAIVAIMLEQLEAQPGMNVLEIGAGTGYNAALLGQLVGPQGHVTTIDIDDDIVAQAQRHLRANGATNVEATCGDGGLGYAARAPYDRIILTVGAWDIVPAWFAQLKVGGRIVLPLGLSARQYSLAFDKQADHLRSHNMQLCGFMRLRGAFASSEQVKVVGAFTLGGESLAQLDVDKLVQLMQQPAQTHELPQSDSVQNGDLLDYLLLHESSLLVLPNDKDKRPFNYAYALYTPTLDSLALLVNLDEKQWNVIAEVRVYGHDATFKKLTAQIAAFDAAGRPSLAHSQIQAYPLGRAPSPTATQQRIVRKWMEYLITFDQSGHHR